jgi:hypothetical protein
MPNLIVVVRSIGVLPTSTVNQVAAMSIDGQQTAVVGDPTRDVVRTEAPIEQAVGSPLTRNVIGSPAAEDRVRTPPASQGVIAPAAPDVVVTCKASDHVITG